jgi:phenylalanyl-tRNA synthetase beta chain
VIDLLPLKGGENTAISNGTTNVLLHSIVCDPVITRRTSQALGLRSDSSAVTERGVDPNGTTRACLKALELILKVAGGEVASELIETPKEPYPNWKVSVSHEKIESILGIKVSPKQVKDIFESLELQVTQSETKGPIYSVTIPTFRNDLHIAEDLIEEIGRLIGYDNFPKTLPSGPVSVTPVAYARDYDREYAVKNILKGAGYSEIYTYSLVSEEQLIKLGVNPAQALRLDNPVSKEYEYLRPRMIGNLLEAIKLNQPNFAEIKLYELGKHYTGETADKTQEEYWLSGAETGERFYEVKGIVESLLAQMGIVCQISPAEKNNQGHPGRQAIITAQDKFLGFLGEIHPALLAKFGIKGHVTGFTLNYDLLVKLVNPARKYQPPSQYPPIIEDLTLTLPEKTLVGQVTDSIKSASKLIAQVELTSVHDRNFTFRITYQDKTKNLTDKDIEAIRKRLEKIV